MNREDKPNGWTSYCAPRFLFARRRPSEFRFLEGDEIRTRYVPDRAARRVLDESAGEESLAKPLSHGSPGHVQLLGDLASA